MKKQVYEDYKYVMVDTSYLYIGAKHTYGELMELESMPFKMMTILERYIIPDMGMDTTVESHLYYMQAADFTCRTLMQLKAKVKVNRLTVKKRLFGKAESIYKTEIMSLAEHLTKK